MNPDATFRRLLIPEREAAYNFRPRFAVYRALALAATWSFSAWFVALCQHGNMGVFR